ncbi:hypothetical protein [Litoribaculum gwangyangense]|uniref:Uncharacterized protein n=1 Tax=Litoribaculum gwangyangense TaxID=1130722 RepID=A0ABP9CWV9_9FLAO
MTPILFKHNDTYNPTPKKDRITWFKGLLSGRMEEYKTQRNLELTEYWITESEDNGYIKSIGLDFSKRPLSRTKDLLKEYPDNNFSQAISKELFTDIYEMAGLRDWDRLVKITSKYLNLWSQQTNPNAPEFPVLLIEQTGIYTYFSNVEEFTRIHIAQYPWDGGEYLIDRNLNEFETEYWNFGHPTGVVIPKGIKRKWTKEELIKNLEDEPPEWLK